MGSCPSAIPAPRIVAASNPPDTIAAKRPLRSAPIRYRRLWDAQAELGMVAVINLLSELAGVGRERAPSPGCRLDRGRKANSWQIVPQSRRGLRWDQWED